MNAALYPQTTLRCGVLSTYCWSICKCIILITPDSNFELYKYNLMANCSLVIYKFNHNNCFFMILSKKKQQKVLVVLRQWIFVFLGLALSTVLLVHAQNQKGFTNSNFKYHFSSSFTNYICKEFFTIMEVPFLN